MTLAGLALGTQKIWVCREFRAGEMAGLPNRVSAAISGLMEVKSRWLVEETSRIFGRPVAMRQTGGRYGGGAQLTPLGEAIITRFRATEAAIAEATRDDLAAVQAEVQPPTGG